MDEELFLKGNKYKGRFLGEIKEGKVLNNYRYFSTRYWVEGKGVITNKKTGKEQRFLFKTGLREDKPDELGDVIICFSKSIVYEVDDDKISLPFIIIGKSTFANRIRDNSTIIDLVLERMYENAKNREEEIIPTIYPIPLNLEELVENGLIVKNSE